MRRRLRKKKRIDEFTEFGFEIRAELIPDLSDSSFDAFVDRLIEFVEGRQLAFGGGGSRAFEGFVTHPGRASASDEDRFALSGFLNDDSTVVRYQIGPLVAN
jgi:uncharacterized protein YggL (DUF469 family)